jgi:DNA sulfur modification protein DndD
MRLDSIKLFNWQCYKGEDNVFDFSGSDSTNNSSIIIGRNAQGKSAFFEAIRFVLYGRNAVVDRDSQTTPKRRKPLVAESLERSPLMNWASWEAGEKKFGVTAEITLGDDKFEVSRMITTTSIKPSESDLTEKFHVMHLTSKDKINKPEEFIKTILPMEITKFFMIDGELLIEYRNLFAADRPGLAQDLENILRMGVLDTAAVHLNEIIQSSRVVVRKAKAAETKGQKHQQEVDDLIEEIEEAEGKVQVLDGEISTLESEVESLLSWLQTHGNVAAHVSKLESLQDDKLETESKISKLKKSRSDQFKNGWKQVLTPFLEQAINGEKAILERQEKNRKELADLDARSNALEAHLAGQKCPSCGTEKQLSPSEKASTNDELITISADIKKLRGLAVTPDALPIMNRIESMRGATTDTQFKSVSDINNEIAQLLIQIGTIDEDIDATMDDMGGENLAIGREKRGEHRDKSLELGEKVEMRDLHTVNIENLTTRLEFAQKRTKSKGSNKIITLNEHKQKIADVLQKLCMNAKTPFRTVTRSSVEEQASEMYMSIINQKEEHKRLVIDSQFRLKIEYEDGTYASLSPGQRALATYCVMESLSLVSDIRFPLIVDSPGQGVDKEYMKDIFLRLLGDSSRQIIITPTTAEIDASTAGGDFGHGLSSLYSLNKNSGVTEIIEEFRRA